MSDLCSGGFPIKAGPCETCGATSGENCRRDKRRGTSKKRYVLEGTWSGYRPSQQKVVHREVVSGDKAKRARALHAIIYTDGTSLDLAVRECKPREIIEEKHAYTSLIESALRKGSNIVRVADLA